MENSQPIIIGVTGGSGSGKTSVSRAILSDFPDHSIMMSEQDSYYGGRGHLGFEECLNTNYDYLFAFDTDLLIQHVEQLLNYQVIGRPVYDHVVHTGSTGTVIQESKEVIILEGILILEDRRLRDLMDTKVYVDTDDDIRIIRRTKRDMEERDRTLGSMIKQCLTAVKPIYHQFIEPMRCYVDVIVPEGGENHVATDLIDTKVDSILTKM